jgi:hypothetical protein
LKNLRDGINLAALCDAGIFLGLYRYILIAKEIRIMEKGVAEMKWILALLIFALFGLILTVLPLHASIAHWAESNGGNGHYYELVFETNPTWFDARDAAASRTHLGLTGHLATLTTAAEQDFLIDAFGAGEGVDSGMNQMWVGGFQTAGQDPTPGESPEAYTGWQWITGEAWISEGPAAPNFSFNNNYFDTGLTEEHLITWWNDGGLNDFYHSPTGTNDPDWDHSRGYIVEYSSASVPIPGAFLLLGSGLVGLVVIKRKKTNYKDEL